MSSVVMARPKEHLLANASAAFLVKCEKERTRLIQKLTDQYRFDLNRCRHFCVFDVVAHLVKGRGGGFCQSWRDKRVDSGSRSPHLFECFVH